MWSIATSCSGRFYDRQNSCELSRTGKACGCYSMDTRVSSAVIEHKIEVRTMRGEQMFDTLEYSSNEFTSLYMKNPPLRNIP